MTPINDDRVWLIDGRDLDPEEDEAVAASGIHHVTVAEIAADPLRATSTSMSMSTSSTQRTCPASAIPHRTAHLPTP